MKETIAGCDRTYAPAVARATTVFEQLLGCTLIV
jgi:hypothetical protein